MLKESAEGLTLILFALQQEDGRRCHAVCTPLSVYIKAYTEKSSLSQSLFLTSYNILFRLNIKFIACGLHVLFDVINNYSHKMLVLLINNCHYP